MTLILLKKELTGITASLQGLIVPVVFLVATGLLLWVFDGAYNIPEQGYASLSGLFELAPVLFLILIPALCMRSFSEEKKSGTEELLLTAPIPVWKIVVAKFSASSCVIFFTIFLTGISWMSVYLLGSPPGNLDAGVTLGGYTALILTALLFVSFGVFTSSLSGNQITAFIVGVFLCIFFYWGFEPVSSLMPDSELQSTIRNIGILPHYKTLCQGIVDSRDVIYYLVWIVFFPVLTGMNVFARRSW